MVTSRVVRLIKVIQPSIDKCQQNSQGRAFSFDNYPAVIRTCRRYYHLLHLSSKIQRSQVSAFHASYRISLRSSSIHDPSDPPFRVIHFCLVHSHIRLYSKQLFLGWRGKPQFLTSRGTKRSDKHECRSHRWTEVAGNN